jgi:hypothetical protein
MPYRVIFSAGRSVTDHKVVVEAAAVQFANGWIDDGEIMTPSITVSNVDRNEWGLNSDQAREPAAVLLEAADELDRWASASG